jgi:hypothetical protein
VFFRSGYRRGGQAVRDPIRPFRGVRLKRILVGDIVEVDGLGRRFACGTPGHN